MKWFRKKQATLADNDTFVTLIRVAQDDPNIRKQLQGILILPSLQRKYLLKTLIVDMKSDSAPSEFIEAIACLLDDEVACKALEVICK